MSVCVCVWACVYIIHTYNIYINTYELPKNQRNLSVIKPARLIPRIHTLFEAYVEMPFPWG